MKTENFLFTRLLCIDFQHGPSTSQKAQGLYLGWTVQIWKVMPRSKPLTNIGDDPATAPLLKQMRGADGKPTVCENVWIFLSHW